MDRVTADFVRAARYARRCRLRQPGAALRARLPAVELPLAADQPAHRRVRRLAGQPAALPARGVRRGARGVAAAPADVGAHLGHDWFDGGNTADDAVAIARAFKAAGADMIDCSSGQVSVNQKPIYGRMYQTPFADRIRNEVGIADHRGRRDLRGRPRQQHHRRRPGRPVRGGAAAPRQSGLDSERGRQDRLHRHRLAAPVPHGQAADGKQLPARTGRAGSTAGPGVRREP